MEEENLVRSSAAAGIARRRLLKLPASLLLLAAACSTNQTGPVAGSEASASNSAASALSEALTFHASFDKGSDADFGLGDRRIYTARTYKDLDQAAPGIGSPAIEVAAGEGRFGDALRFKTKNTQALFYRAENNVAYKEKDWSGTVSFWLSLDPAVELEPGYCDPIQVTDAAYNDAALWVDFTKENPRRFRLGVFGDLEVWNPENRGPDDNPDFQRRLVVINHPPFARGKWTHVVITHSGLNTEAGVAKLYLDGELRGAAQGIREPFGWDLQRAAIRLGVNYVGLYDEVAVFGRALSEDEVWNLHELEKGVSSLHP